MSDKIQELLLLIWVFVGSFIVIGTPVGSGISSIFGGGVAVGGVLALAIALATSVISFRSRYSQWVLAKFLAIAMGLFAIALLIDPVSILVPVSILTEIEWLFAALWLGVAFSIYIISAILVRFV